MELGGVATKVLIGAACIRPFTISSSFCKRIVAASLLRERGLGSLLVGAEVYRQVEEAPRLTQVLHGCWRSHFSFLSRQVEQDRGRRFRFATRFLLMLEEKTDVKFERSAMLFRTTKQKAILQRSSDGNEVAISRVGVLR